MNFVRLLGAALMVTSSAAAEPLVLENSHVRIEIDPAAGGAVTRMLHKKAVVLPIIAERGAQVAGIGRFFVPVIQAGDAAGAQALDGVSLAAERAVVDAEQRLTLRGSLEAIAPGLSIERTFRLAADESGLRIADTYRCAAGQLRLRVGAASRHEAAAWNLTRRCWFGDALQDLQRLTPRNRGMADDRQTEVPEIHWRTISQYGLGMLYQVRCPRMPADLAHRVPKEDGYPSQFQWLSAPAALAAGRELTVSGSVMIDEGGRAGGGAAQRAASDRVLLTLDAPVGGRSGKPADCYATLVSARARQVKLVLRAQRRMMDWKDGRDEPAATVLLAKAELKLEPGLALVHHFELAPKGPGLAVLTAEIHDADGQVLAQTSARQVVDGEALKADSELGKVWSDWTARLPELELRGSWEEIGAQLAQRNLLKDALKSGPPKNLAVYEKHYPFYARLLKGAAEARGMPVEELTAVAEPAGRAEPASPVACMDLLVNGPDGPIQLFSKERPSGNKRGMAYCKVVPDTGYRYHMYTLNSWTHGYGVNSAGLATSGATMNCSKESETAAIALARQRHPDGTVTMPLRMHMLLAMCKDVEEAIALINNSEAPLEFNDNLLISDIHGNGIILNSWGTYHWMMRTDGRERFATGNYPIEAPDSPFRLGPNWGWGANTMLREHAVREYMRRRDFKVSLRDAFIIMDGQNEPGNMNQNVFENPGLLYSTASIIAVARTGELYISNGPPHLAEYVPYKLND